MSTTDPSSPPEVRDWEAVQSSPEFQDLRHRLRSFVFPVTGLFLAWYLLFVLLACFAPAFMSTFAIAIWYTRYANRRLDPLGEQLRSEIEGPATERTATPEDGAVR